MFSLILFGFSRPNACMILLFFLSYFQHFSCALSQIDPKFCDTLFHCGNITAGFPFWGEGRPELCGHPSLGLRCDQHSSKTFLVISGQMYRVLHIDNSTNTLGLARQDFLGESFCNSTLTGTTLTPELFQLSPEYTTLNVYYLCGTHLHNPSNFKCPKLGAASLHRSNENHKHCPARFNITVPTSYIPEREALHLNRIFSVLKEGFKVKLMIDGKPCQECKSTGRICGYNVATPVCCERNYSSKIHCSRMIPSGSSADEHHKKCASGFRCGNQRNLSYPFWIPGRQECGHPDFEVNCSGDLAEFSISSVKFQILEMNFGIRIARKDYHNNLCPQNPENPIINLDVLPFTPATMMSTLYYNCSDPMVNLPCFHIRQLHCDKDIGGHSYFVSSASHSLDSAIFALCERNVSIPVSRSAFRIEDGNPTLEVIKKALNDGFELTVNPDCMACVKSEGVCGYNDSSRAFVCYCADKPHEHTCHSEIAKTTSLSRTAKIAIGVACGFLGSIATGLLVFMVFSLGLRKRKPSHHSRYQNLKGLLQLKEYSSSEVKKITKSFSHTVGKGGFGTVYGGNLCNGRKVAVKVLKDFKSNGEDFINELASMSQTSHVNIVSLLGFCYKGSKRAIVYEFLENGSLDQFISKKKSLNLDVTKLYGIALGTARGLEYLHHGCKTRIVHFDIKPQNVLLDDNLCPKVSDFGLAKLCEKRESMLSLLDTRGTIGYIAPEIFSRMYGRVSHKSDVYSYGMLVLEMIGARNKETVETAASDSSSMYFPDWIYKDLENGEYTWVTGDDTKEEKDMAKKMILVALWCIQPCPLNRPPMNRVVEMMEGSLDAIEVPPKPSMHISTTPLPESSCILEESSNNSED